MALEHLRQDLRFGARLMARTPGVTLIVVLTLAIGIGATTAIFTILQAVLLRPLPYRDPGTLIAIWDGHPRERNLSKVFASYDDFETWRDHSRSVDAIAAATWATGEQILSGRGPARVVLAIPVTIDFFTLLGVSPAMGRTFHQDDLGEGCTVVLASRFWHNTLGAAANIVGQSLALDDRSCTVVGVMPAGFAFYPDAADMWTLIAGKNQLLAAGVGVFARLKPHVSLEAAQAELTMLHRQQHGTDTHGATLTPTAYELQDEFTWLAGRNLRATLLVLFAAVSAVLLIACLNVANVLLGRSVARQREFAVRAALGAGQSRLLRQLLTEGFLLSILGTVIGVLLAATAVHYFRVSNPIELPPGSAVALDVPVLVFSAGLTVLTAMVFGLGPALEASQIDLTTTLKAGGRTGSNSSARRAVGRLLVMVEMTCSVVLLVGAGLLIRSVERFGSAPLGFDPDGVTTMALRLPTAVYGDVDARRRFYEDVTAAVGRVPGMNSVALATTFVRGRGNDVLLVEGRPEPAPDIAVPDVGQTSIGDRYFDVLKVPLLAGRRFEVGDRAESSPVAIVNEALARKYFPEGHPIGAHVRLRRDTTGPWLTIVGIAGNQKDAALHQEMSWVDAPSLFRPILQTVPSQAALFLRADAPPTTLTGSVQQIIAEIDPDVPVSDVQTMRSRLARTMAYPQFRAAMLTVFAGVALVLAVVGLYGVLSQLVAQRTHEIGIRIALGATKTSVLVLVARQGLAIAGIGLVLGLVAASWLGRFVDSMLYGVRPTDAVMLVLASVSLGSAAVLATYLPARRAVRIDPVQALRHD